MPEELKRMFRRAVKDLDARYDHFVHKVMIAVAVAFLCQAGMGYFLYAKIQTERNSSLINSCEDDRRQNVAVKDFVLSLTDTPERKERFSVILEDQFPTDTNCEAFAKSRTGE